MTHSKRPFALLVAGVCALTVAGCATAGSKASNFAAPVPSSASLAAMSTPTVGSSPQGVNVAAFDALAKQEAAAWPKSAFAETWRTSLVILNPADLTPSPKGFQSGQAESAVNDGNLVFTGSLPSDPPSGVVTWPGGSTMKVKLLSEQQSFGQMAFDGCPTCHIKPIDVTAARLTTLAIATSRGIATTPAWAFTIQGVSAPVIRTALARSSYVTLPIFSTPPEKLGPVGADFAEANAAAPSADGRTLTLAVEASPCATSWGGLVSEVGGAIVVGGWEHVPNPNQPCTPQGFARKVTIRLAKPVGDRVILDAATGEPVNELAVVLPTSS